jgi:N-acetylneuraminate lyase
MTTHLEGLIAAPFSPFDASGDLNLKIVEQQAEHLVADGVRGAFICGTTGESASLTLDERFRLAQRWRDVAGESLTIIIHVGDNCQANAIAFASHAQRMGVGAIACLAPCFFKPSSADDLADFLAPIAASAPHLPFYLYHLPALTGGTLLASDVLRAGAPKIPNLVGVKFTHEDLMDFAECSRLQAGRFNALFGRDEILLAALSLGAKGAVGSTYNFAAPLYRQIMEAFGRGDLETARAKQAKSVAFIQVMSKFGGLPAGKAIMHLIGIDCGPVRSPLGNLDAIQIANLQSDLDAIGFFDWARKP